MFFYDLKYLGFWVFELETKNVVRKLTSLMASANDGLQSNNQRLGVMPLVLFWNFSGVSS